MARINLLVVDFGVFGDDTTTIGRLENIEKTHTEARKITSSMANASDKEKDAALQKALGKDYELLKTPSLLNRKMVVSTGSVKVLSVLNKRFALDFLRGLYAITEDEQYHDAIITLKKENRIIDLKPVEISFGDIYSVSATAIEVDNHIVKKFARANYYLCVLLVSIDDFKLPDGVNLECHGEALKESEKKVADIFGLKPAQIGYGRVLSPLTGRRPGVKLNV